MNVVVPVEITKEDVERLADILESSPDEVLTNFILKVLRKANEITDSMEAAAKEIKDVNPVSFCNVRV